MTVRDGGISTVCLTNNTHTHTHTVNISLTSVELLWKCTDYVVTRSRDQGDESTTTAVLLLMLLIILILIPLIILMHY